MSSSPSMAGPLRRGAERRRHPRCRVIEKQLVTVDIGPARRGLLVDVSEGGLAIQPYSPLHTGDCSSVKFYVPSDRTLVEAEAVVTWVGPSGRAGIQFTSLPREGEDSLRAWVNSMNAPATSPVPHVVYSTAAYLPPSYSPWIKIGDVHVDASPLPDDISSLDLVSALRLVVERARSVTRATGAAIALSDGGDMVCRARTGIAPDLSARFRPDTGLSGEAVRTGTVALCNDAESDTRVDHAACQRLNVRSIAILPIMSGSAVIGVVEAFAAKSNAFDDRDVVNLRRLAEVVGAMLENGSEMATPRPFASWDIGVPRDRTRERTRASDRFVPSQNSPGSSCEPDQLPEFTPQPDAAEAQGGSAVSADTVSEADAPKTEEPVATADQPKSLDEINQLYDRFMEEAQREDRQHRRKILFSILIAVLLLAGAFGAYRWFASAPRPARVQAETPLPSLPATQDVKPTTSVSVAETVFAAPIPTPSQKKTAPRREPEMIAENWVWTAPTRPGTGSDMKQLESIDAPPPVPANSAQPMLVSELLTTSSPKPQLAPPPSQTPLQVREGRLLTRVNPMLPPMAAASGVHGSVVVKLAIARNGKVEKAQLVNGNPILGGAAIKALGRWRYEPFTLNGQPVPVEKVVTINFAERRLP